ncbi:MAG: flagellar basal body-associated FliL family protein [Bacteriovoracaceae bacterium]|nr:flagellar basal body-associated FliL family protein [Bacteriovoracaceae bacterium]
MTGNVLVDKILVAVFAFISLACFGLSYYTYNMIKTAPISPKAEYGAMVENAKVAGQVETVALKSMVINLYSRSTRLRFLDIQINVLPFNGSQAELILQKESIIADTVITIAGDMEPDELNSVSGKIILEDRIKKQVNSMVGEPLMKKIYFSKFVIQ